MIRTQVQRIKYRGSNNKIILGDEAANHHTTAPGLLAYSVITTDVVMLRISHKQLLACILATIG
jgi:hypothetical protein